MRNVRAAEVSLPSTDLAADLAFFTERLGFALVSIFPADDPAVAVVRGHGLQLRLQRSPDEGAAATSSRAPVLRLLCEDLAQVEAGARAWTSPGGTRGELVAAEPTLVLPTPERRVVVSRLAGDAPWVTGRAGMLYRDLIPGRLGGAIIASHIKIPEAGPVPDLVHYHAVHFQLIFCCHGWVRLVYEDQGPPFVLRAGDCVIQPPQIRHRVLESSANLQVVEVGLPAQHLTLADHELALPTAQLRPTRDFGGQRFCHSLAADAAWSPGRVPGFEVRDTGVGDATAGVAAVAVVRPMATVPASAADAGAVVSSHDAEILFSFVLAGRATLRIEGQAAHAVTFGDAWVTPPQTLSALAGCSTDLEVLEVALPGRFVTQLHPAARLG